jgi:hypothetical protein
MVNPFNFSYDTLIYIYIYIYRHTHFTCKKEEVYKNKILINYYKKCIKYIPQKSKFKLVGDLNFSLSKEDEKQL